MDKEKNIESGSLFKFAILLLLIPAVFVINNLVSYLLSWIFGLQNGMLLFATISLIQAILIIGFTFYLARNLWLWGFKELGLGLENLKKGFRGGLKYGPLVFFLVVFGGVLMEKIKPFEGEMQPFAQLVIRANSFPELLMLGLLGVIIAPLAEEIYFRGLLFPIIKKHLGVAGGIIVSGLIFGLMHFDLLRFLPLALGGMALAYLYHKTNSLYTAITAHGVWNGIMLLILHFFQNYPVV